MWLQYNLRWIFFLHADLHCICTSVRSSSRFGDLLLLIISSLIVAYVTLGLTNLTFMEKIYIKVPRKEVCGLHPLHHWSIN